MWLKSTKKPAKRIHRQVMIEPMKTPFYNIYLILVRVRMDRICTEFYIDLQLDSWQSQE